MTDSLTRAFVERLLAWPADAAALQERCQLLLVDGVAVAAAGALERAPRLMAELARADGAAGGAMVIGQGFKAPPAVAARINGMAMHVLDFEPMWSPPNHAMSPLLPALLALAEQREAALGAPQGEALLRALALGIEAQGRLRMSSQQFEPGRLSLHPPGVVGPIATALACAALLGLDATATTMAVGIAASRCGALLANVGSHTKSLHCGDAAAHGLEAALLAQRGFTASPDALGGPRGWGHAFFGTGFDADALLTPMGKGRALDPGPSWKLFPSQFATHYGITAALDVRAQSEPEGTPESTPQSTLQNKLFQAQRVRRVHLRVPSMPYIERPAPSTGLEGKFSWQYTVAVALLDGKVVPASFTDERRRGADVEALLGRFELVADPAIPGDFDNMYVELTVQCDDGTELAARCDAPLGSWRRPVAPERIMDKARGLLDATLGTETMQAVLDAATQPPQRLSARELLAALG